MSRTAALIAGTIVLFLVSVVVLIEVIPGPHKSTDYLVIGGVSTMVCVIVLFLVLITTSGQRSSALYKKRKRTTPDGKPD